MAAAAEKAVVPMRHFAPDRAVPIKQAFDQPNKSHYESGPCVGIGHMKLSQHSVEDNASVTKGAGRRRSAMGGLSKAAVGAIQVFVAVDPAKAVDDS